VRFVICSLFSSIGNDWLFKLRPGGALRWKAEDCRLGRAGSVMWQVGTSNVVALICVN
jgi:hypothetical protein